MEWMVFKVVVAGGTTCNGGAKLTLVDYRLVIVTLVSWHCVTARR